MFQPGKTNNYCYFEYDHACKCLDGEKCFIFLLAEKSYDSFIQARRNVYPEYYEWYNDILSKDIITIEPTEEYSVINITLQLNIIRKQLVDKIEKKKWEIIENVPD